jgi:hypothetical protein
MNERIRELIEQATTIEEHGWGASYENFDREKFAQLIVGHAIECVRDVLRDENSDLSYEGASQVQKHLREFFGVEE